MSRRLFGVPRALFATLLVSGGALTLASCTQRPPPEAGPTEPAPPFKAVATVKDLMLSVIDPSADVVWEAVATIITKAGIEERQPRTEDEWARVRHAAVTLAESGNLLMLEPRAYDRASWMTMSRAFIEVSTEVLKVVEAKDAQGVFDLGERLDRACESCHLMYAYEDSPLRKH